jgi:hypothetical protein
MLRSSNIRTMREPVDRRRMRLIQTMLAFPAAGIVGLGGQALVKRALAHEATASARQRPGESTDENTHPDDRGAETPAVFDDDASRAGNA